MDKRRDTQGSRSSQDIFLGYVVRRSTSGEFLASCRKHPASHLPPYVSYPAWAHRYDDLEEAQQDALATGEPADVVCLCDQAGHYVIRDH